MENIERVLVAARQGADTKPDVRRHLEAITRRGEHAGPGQCLAQRPRIAAVAQPGKARGAAGGRRPAERFAMLVHEPGEQREIGLGHRLQPAKIASTCASACAPMASVSGDPEIVK